MHTEFIQYADGSTSLEGFLAYDPTIKGKRPAVIVSHAWGGQDDFARGKAKALADLGYVGFALDMYGKGQRGSNPDENARLMQPFMDDRAMLARRINAAVTCIKSHFMVDSHRIGAIGFCFGGLCVLDLARSGTPGVQGVVSFHGMFGPPPQRAAKTISSKVLALHGWDDPLAKPDSVLAFAREMTDAKADWQLHAYGHTAHAFTNPQANMREHGIMYHEDSDQRSWIAMKNFFEEVFE